MTIDQPWVLFGVFPLVAYLAGSIPFGVLIARSQGIDIRAHGSGNTGATNVLRIVGKRWGILCCVLDVLKGLLPSLAAGVLLTGLSGKTAPTPAQQLSWVLVALAAICGHVFSVWLKFRGGKGVATAFGVVVGIWPFFTVAGLAGLGVWIVVTRVSRFVSVGSMMSALSLAPLFVAWNWMILGWTAVIDLWPMVAMAVVMGLLIVIRHRSNIAKLLAGTEGRIDDPRGQE